MKNRINTKNWKEFSYEDFFEPVNNTIKLSNKDLNDNGNIPVYSSSTINNGCFGYTEKEPNYIVDKKRPMYLIFGDHTKSMFIIKESFSIMDNVKVFIPKIFNEYCIRFITTVWQKNIPNIGYARHWTIAKNTPILLPVDSKGEPDWCYMEKCMKETEDKVRKTLKRLNKDNKENTKIDIADWREFKIGDLFDIHPTKSYKMNNSSLLVEDGTNPVVVNSSYNNGIGGYTNFDCTEEGNIITFSDTTSADSIFYQRDKFIGYSHVQGMYPIGKYQYKWNEYSYLFFITLFRAKAINLNYDYVNKFTRESAREIMIKLPVDFEGNPNWNYMEQYMSKVFNKAKNKLTYLNYME